MGTDQTSENLSRKIWQLENQIAVQAETRHRLESALKELAITKQMLGNIIDGNPIPTFILNNHHEVIYWNQSLEKLSGIRARDVVGTKDPWKGFYAHKRPVMADLIVDGVDELKFWKYYKDNSKYTTLAPSSLKEGAFESQDFFPNFGKNGMWLFVSACPLTDEAGNVIGAVETLQDVTKMILAQKEARKNERKYRSLFEEAGDAFFLMVNDRLIDCNAMSLKLFNCSSEDILGHSIFEFFQPADQDDDALRKDMFEDKIVQAYGGENQRFHWRFSGLFGKIFDANVMLSRVEIHGRYVIQVVIRDISEHVRVEKELSRLRLYFSNVIDSMPSILIGITEKGSITHWNTRAEIETGVKAVKAESQQVGKILPRLENKMPQIKAAIKNKKIFEEAKIPFEREDELRYENFTVFPLTGEDTKGAVIRIDDVTDQVRMEEMFIQSEKMASVGSLAAGLAHEINNPLAGMMQNAQVLINRLSKPLPANIRVAGRLGLDMNLILEYMREREIGQLAENINTSGKRAAKIIRNVLSFSRKSHSKKRWFSIVDIIEKTIDIAKSDYDLKSDYDFKQIEIVREFESGLPAVLCDESKMSQVFWNILKNGAEAMQEKNNRSRFIIRTYTRQDQVTVEIEDNGPGIDSGNRKRLFDPFFTTKGNGTGLGLAISYFIIVKDHGGKLSIESEKGKGSKFIIRFAKEG